MIPILPGRNHMGVILSKVRCKLMTPQMYQLPTTSSGKQPPLPARRPILNQMTARLIQQRDTIHIPNSKYKELSILSVDPFPLEGHHWWSVQHYFQAKKFRSALVVDQILKTPSPKKAFQIGTDRNNSHVSLILVGLIGKPTSIRDFWTFLHTVKLGTVDADYKNIVGNCI